MTLEEHWFHPGRVTARVVMDENEATGNIWVEVESKGTDTAPWLNNRIGLNTFDLLVYRTLWGT